MRFLKILLKVLGGLVLLIVVLLAFMVTTVDDTPYKEMAYYQQWKKSVGSLPITNRQSPIANALNIGWAKVNLTPKSPTSTAGYGVRKGLCTRRCMIRFT